MRRSHRFDVVPGQQQVDIGLLVPACYGFQDTGQIGMGFDLVEFTSLDQGCDDGPVLGTRWPEVVAEIRTSC